MVPERLALVALALATVAALANAERLRRDRNDWRQIARTYRQKVDQLTEGRWGG